MTSKPTLAIIVPVHNEAEGIVQNMTAVAQFVLKCEVSPLIVLIDDGSKDTTWDLIDTLSDKVGVDVKGLKLSRNYGKDAAILCGLNEVEADYYLVIDSDGEHPFKEIPSFIDKIMDERYEVVHGLKKNRKRGRVASFVPRLYNKFYSFMTRTEMGEASDYKIFTRKFRDAMIKVGDADFFFRGVALNLGFDHSAVYFSENNRTLGQSSWSLMSLVKYGLRNIIGFTKLPLYLVLVMGVITAIIGAILGFKALIQLGMGTVPEGYVTILILLLINFGMLMTAIGILGIYIAKIFDATRGRPRYLIAERFKSDEA